jgi:transcriptional regulator with XRE-family HTH domain
MIKIGAKIKQARKKAGMNQQALATISDVTQSIVSRWEKDVLIPDIPTLEKIAKCTNKPMVWFFEEAEEKVTLGEIKQSQEGKMGEEKIVEAINAQTEILGKMLERLEAVEKKSEYLIRLETGREDNNNAHQEVTK